MIIQLLFSLTLENACPWSNLMWEDRGQRGSCVLRRREETAVNFQISFFSESLWDTQFLWFSWGNALPELIRVAIDVKSLSSSAFVNTVSPTKKRLQWYTHKTNTLRMSMSLNNCQMSIWALKQLAVIIPSAAPFQSLSVDVSKIHTVFSVKTHESLSEANIWLSF